MVLHHRKVCTVRCGIGKEDKVATYDIAFACLGFGGLILIIAIGIASLLHLEKKQANTWKVLAEGEFHRAEYGYYEYSRRHGAMIHTTSYHRMDVTAVYLYDGRSYVADGRLDMPFPSGTEIRISRNGLGDTKVERA